MTIYADDQRRYRYLHPVALLFLCWIVGLVLGACLCKPSFLPLMCGAAAQPVSIVGLFLVIFLPLILTYFSFLLNKPIIIMIVCFLKAFAFSFSGILIAKTFTSAAWMIRIFLLFSDWCSVFLLFHLWIRALCCSQNKFRTNIRISFAIGAIIAIIDYCVISPFLKGLF